MKSILLFFVILMEICSAQQGHLADVFPLAIGNEWTYEFWTTNTVSHSGTHDNGSVYFTIIGKITSIDSTQWQFFQRRNYTHTIFFPGQTNYYSIQDSNSFEIVEFNYGNHELYTPVYDPLSTFPFQKLANDSSSRFFRYMDVDSTGNSIFTVNFPNVNDPYLSYSCSFTLIKDTGIVQSGCYQHLDHQIGFMASGYNLTNFYNSQSQTNITSHTNILPAKTILFQNYPNPFNPTTRIDFQIPKESYIYIKVFDCLGNEIQTLVSENKKEGSYTIEFDASNLANGIYFYQMAADNFISTKKMLVLK
jgi:hypothetical protein